MSVIRKRRGARNAEKSKPRKKDKLKPTFPLILNEGVNTGYWAELCFSPDGYPDNDDDPRFCMDDWYKGRCTCARGHSGPHAAHTMSGNATMVWPQQHTDAAWRELTVLVKLLG